MKIQYKKVKQIDIIKMAENKKELFNQAFIENDLGKMEEYYSPSNLDNYYIDIALEEGNLNKVNFFLDKGAKPSLFANQMARINGYNKLANQMDTMTDFRNKASVYSVYRNYDRSNKKMNWNPIVPEDFKF